MPNYFPFVVKVDSFELMDGFFDAAVAEFYMNILNTCENGIRGMYALCFEDIRGGYFRRVFEFQFTVGGEGEWKCCVFEFDGSIWHVNNCVLKNVHSEQWWHNVVGVEDSEVYCFIGDRYGHCVGACYYA